MNLKDNAPRPEYPLRERAAGRLRAASGLPLEELTLEAARAGRLAMGDLQASAETLRAQAEIAEQAGYPQVAGNLRRAAELTAVPNAEVLAMYNLLRPGRAAQGELLALAARLEADFHAPECARLVREAAEVYQARRLLRET